MNPQQQHDNQLPRNPGRSASAEPAVGFVLRRAVLFPNVYVWYVLFASLDVILTWVILHWGGSELNALADWIIRRHDLLGIVTYKFALVLFVVLICEIVGRRNRRRGLKLARWAVILTAFPVVVALIHLMRAIGDTAP